MRVDMKRMFCLWSVAGLLGFFLFCQDGLAVGVVTATNEASLSAALAGGGLVTFAVDGTITLTNTLAINSTTTLDGSGHNITISGGNAVGVFTVGSVFTLTNVTIANGWGLNYGAFRNNGTLILVNCTISSNNTSGSLTSCGGVLDAGTLIANGCTFIGNGYTNSTEGGTPAGAILMFDASSGGGMALTNCTFFGNEINSAATISQFSSGGNFTSSIVNCTIAGTVFNETEAPYVSIINLENSIVYSCSGITDEGFNISAGGANFTHASSHANTNPLLAPLANNGGPTLTMALLPGSPAIDAAEPVRGINSDQRGVPRPYGARPDIGAFELSGLDGFYYSSYVLAPPNISNVMCQLSAFGPTGKVMRIQKSANLSNWVDVITNTINSSGFMLINDPMNSAKQKFYRAVSP
jgi:hypothetical protein